MCRGLPRASDNCRVISFFSIPKPCVGHIGVIQRNAVRSWAALACACGGEVMLMGNDAGVAQLAQEVKATHIPGVATTHYGTPRVDDLFDQAQRRARHKLLRYVNADIVLLSDFVAAADAASRGRRQLLMVGQRWDTPITESLPFDEAVPCPPLPLGEGGESASRERVLGQVTDARDGSKHPLPSPLPKGEGAGAVDVWEQAARELAAREGKLHKPTGIDYFLFTPRLFDPIPPFAIGRTAWDNWLIYRARSRRAAVIDATRDVLAIHQNHDYAHGGGYKAVWKGSEARTNFELAGGDAHIFTIWDASHVLEHGKLRENTTTSLGGGIWNYRRSARYGV